MRRHGHHGWQWTPVYDARHGPTGYKLPRRSSWDLRCEEALCAETVRKTPRRKPIGEQARWRAGALRR